MKLVCLTTVTHSLYNYYTHAYNYSIYSKDRRAIFGLRGTKAEIPRGWGTTGRGNSNRNLTNLTAFFSHLSDYFTKLMFDFKQLAFSEVLSGLN